MTMHRGKSSGLLLSGPWTMDHMTPFAWRVHVACQGPELWSQLSASETLLRLVWLGSNSALWGDRMTRVSGELCSGSTPPRLWSLWRGCSRTYNVWEAILVVF